jgi:hypothetical protein
MHCLDGVSPSEGNEAMPKVLYVVMTYEVVIPDDRTAIEAAIDTDNEHAEDAAIIKGSDEAVAVYLMYKAQDGDFTDMVDVADLDVTDKQPNINEYKLNKED